MTIEYDPEADALYIRFLNVKPQGSLDVEDGITVDLDEKKHLIGIEILDVRHRFPGDTLSTLTVKNLIAA